MGSHQPIRKSITPEIPDKLYFRIGDVARLCEVPAYVLRFWETEFPHLKPNKGGTGQRLYRKRDVEMALRIKSLLYDQGYTIPGARQVFKSEAKVKEVPPAEAAPRSTKLGPERTSGSHLEPETSDVRPPELGRSELGRSGAAHVPLSSVRSAALATLREDMRALLGTLSAPVQRIEAPGPSAVAALNAVPACSAVPAPKLQALRPRMVPDVAGVPPSIKPVSPRPGLRTDAASADLKRDLFTLSVTRE